MGRVTRYRFGEECVLAGDGQREECAGDKTPGVGFVVRVAGLGSSDPEFEPCFPLN